MDKYYLLIFKKIIIISRSVYVLFTMSNESMNEKKNINHPKRVIGKRMFCFFLKYFYALNLKLTLNGTLLLCFCLCL